MNQINKAVLIIGLTALTFFSLPVLAKAVNENSFDYALTEGITASPAITLSTKYDDNIFLQDSSGVVKSSWITQLAPSVTLGTQKGVNFYTAKYTLKAGRYHSSRNDDYVDHLFNIDTHTEFNHRNKLDVKFDYLKLHESRGTGVSESDTQQNARTSPDKYDDTFLSGTYTYGGSTAKGRIQLDASYLDKKYTNNRDRTRAFDRNEDVLGATFFYRVMPKTFLLFEAKNKDIDYDNKRNNTAAKLDGDEQTYQAGVTWEATAKTTGIAKLGKTYKNFDASEYKDDDITTWELGAEWALRSYSIVKIFGSSKPDETNNNNRSTFIKKKTLGVSWRHGWSDQLHSTLATRFTNDDYMDSPRKDDLELYKAGLEYQFRRGIAFGVDYTYRTRDSNAFRIIDNAQIRDYTDNIFMLTAKIGL